MFSVAALLGQDVVVRVVVAALFPFCSPYICVCDLPLLLAL